MKRKTALCVGINDYPGTGADLQGCVNDALDWSTALQLRGYTGVVLLDADATKDTVLSILNEQVRSARFGDRIVFTYSGHGTWLPDRDGDEIDGRDEALVMHDYNQGGFITDDELHAVFAQARYGVRVVVISDSCHSGTMNRAVKRHPAGDIRPRFLSPASFPELHLSFAEAVRAEHFVATKGSRAFGGMVLMSGCADNEYSYDAWIGDRPRGAFTATALRVLGQSEKLKLWHKFISQELPSNVYPQSPQLQLSKRHQGYWRL